MSALRALLWDVDGTLAETEELHRRAFERAFADFGLDVRWPPELYRELLKVTGGRERLRHYFSTYRPDLLERVDVAALHAHKTRIYGELVACGPELRPGVVRLLREARKAGLRQAVVTTTSRVNVQALLDRTLGAEADGIFELWVTGEDVARKKPAPDLHLRALERLDLPASACLALEDSALGLAAARAAGIAVVVVCSPWTADGDFTGACAVFDGFGDPDAPCRRLDPGPQPEDGLLRLAELRRIHAACTDTAEKGGLTDAGPAC